MREGLLAGGATLLLFAILLSGGGPTERAGTVVIGLGGDPASLDPARISSVRDGRLVRALFEGLTTLDPVTLEPQPAAARAWEVSGDHRRWTFHLRDDLRWSNGDRCTAEDFLRSWLRLLDPEEGCPYQHLLWCVRGAQAYSEGTVPARSVGLSVPDPTTLVVELTDPLPHFLSLTSTFSLVPVHGPSVVASGGSALTAPDRLVSNGPFRLLERTLRDRVVVVRNEFFHAADEVSLERIEYLAAESPTTLLNLFLAGEADWVTEVPTTILPSIADDSRIAEAFTPRPHLEIAFYRVNVTRPPFDDPRVRRALSLALDRRVICESMTRCGEQPAATFVPWPAPALAALDPTAVPPFSGAPRPVVTEAGTRVAKTIDRADWGGLLHDPPRARALLAEAGFRTPEDAAGRAFPPFEIHFSSSPLHQRVAEWIQEQWTMELGLEVRLRRSEGKSALAEQKRLDYDVSRSSWVADYLDPMTFLEVFHSGAGTNRTGWIDTEYDACLAEANALPGGAERDRVLFRAEEILLERGPVIPLWYGVTTTLVSPRLEGLGANALDQQWPRTFRLHDPERAEERH